MKYDEYMKRFETDPDFRARVTAPNSATGQQKKSDAAIDQAAIDQARARFETEQAALYRSDGPQIYGPEEHQERMEPLFAEFDRVADAARQGAEQRIEAANTELQALGTDPFYRMTTEQLQRASALAPFIQQDCERLRFEELAERLTAASVGADPVLRTLYVRYGLQRHDSAVTQQRDGTYRTPGGSGYDVFAGALRHLEAAMQDTKAEAKRAELEQRIRDDQQVIIHANRTRGDLDGTRAAALERARFVAWNG